MVTPIRTGDIVGESHARFPLIFLLFCVETAKLPIMLSLLRKITPTWAFDAYHHALSTLAAAWYGHPSRELIVIGVTGTNGKSSTCYFLSKILEDGGAKTGMTSTAMFKVAEKMWTNSTKMTMLGRFQLQSLLREMVNAGCSYAVVETSSQGIVQHRHRAIAYDACVFTNLTPEHIEAHGGFENYKKAKIELFRHTASLPRKRIKDQDVKRAEILNADDVHAKDFVVKGFDETVWYGLRAGALRATDIKEELDGVRFQVDGTSFHVKTPGRVMVENALAAIAAAQSYGVSFEDAARFLSDAPAMPGRYESIDEGQPFRVIVDYAYEPVALEKLFDFADEIKRGRRIIHITGSAGGGRDVARRDVIGRLSAKRADITIVTNEDPYDDDPQSIIDAVAKGAIAGGKKEGESVFRILDRKEAIEKAISLAQNGDAVLITGKGSEPVMAVAGGKKIPSDDREMARAVLRSRTQ
jgi:UDP-N-acetylmuramoyl-L-alanyl-D-glutamate--2,6-diaminopimelate ligase